MQSKEKSREQAVNLACQSPRIHTDRHDNKFELRYSPNCLCASIARTEYT